MRDDRTLVALRRDVIVEPIWDDWYAWSFLIPPIQAGMYVNGRHLPLMESFVAAPELHVEALRQPGMLGGPYVALPVERREDVAALLDRTRTRARDLLELQQSFLQLEAKVRASTTGSSLEPLYAEIPPALRGCVELVYDRWHQGSVRIIERASYRTAYFREDLQALDLWIGDFDARSFVFTTPRLEQSGAGRLRIAKPFASAGLDALFALRTRSRPRAELRPIADALDVEVEALASLCVQEVAAPSTEAPSSGVRVRYFGHACVLVESPHVSLLVDPLVPSAGRTGVRSSFDALPDTLDYVLITHAHQDHLVLETLLQLRHKIGTIVVPRSAGGTLLDPSLKTMLEVLGFTNVIELAEFEELATRDGRILAIPFLGEHGDLDVRCKSAYGISLCGRTIVVVADSNNLDPTIYENTRAILGPTDVLFIGLECEGAPASWLYGPLYGTPLKRRSDQSRRLSGSASEAALQVTRSLQAKHVFVYAMGSEPWCRFMTSVDYTMDSKPVVESNALIGACRNIGVEQAARLFGAQTVFERQ